MSSELHLPSAFTDTMYIVKAVKNEMIHYRLYRMC